MTDKRPPLLPWSQTTWQTKWSKQRRMSIKPIPRTKFLLIKPPVSTLYENKFGGDINMFTLEMFVERMTSKGISLGCAVDCTALDIMFMEPLEYKDDEDGDKKKKKDVGIRYFHDVKEWDDFDVDYVRLTPSSSPSSSSSSAIVVPGIPSDETIQQFIDTCTNNWKQRPNTHITVFDSRGGLGSGAYLVAAYMCQRMRAPLHIALGGISEVMSPGIFDVELLKHLQRKYKGRKEIIVPESPVWYTDINLDYDEDEEEEDGDGGGDGDGIKEKKKTKEPVVIPPYVEEDKKRSASASSSSSSVVVAASSSTASGSNNGHNNDMGPPPPVKRPRPTTGREGGGGGGGASQQQQQPQPVVSGLVALTKDSSRYERAITVTSQLLGITTTKSLDTFPGCQYTKLTKSLLSTTDTTTTKIIKKETHRVTWYPKGRRGLLLLLTDGVFFIEGCRGGGGGGTDDGGNGDDGDVVRISHATNMHFPRPTKLMECQHRTLLDGILVGDREQNNTVVPRYLAMDVLAHEGGLLLHKPWKYRQKFLKDGVAMVRKHPKVRYDYSRECFKFRVQDVFELEKTKWMITSFLRKVTHDVDGLLFLDMEKPYHVVVTRRGDGDGGGKNKGEGEGEKAAGAADGGTTMMAVLHWTNHPNNKNGEGRGGGTTTTTSDEEDGLLSVDELLAELGV